MSSVQLELVKPTHLWVPDYSFTSGPEVFDLNARAGFVPDPEQRLVLDAVFAEKADGTPAAREIEIVAPRQNIKTGVQLQTMIGWMFLLDIEEALYTAHKWKTAEKTFLALQRIVEGCTFLRRRVKRFYEGNGEQKMLLNSGHLLEFSTRTSTGGRGPSPDKVILDEDFATQKGQIGSLVPSLATRPMAQLLRGSSAGHPGSAALRDVRDRGRARNDRFLAYFEWCAPDPEQACEAGEKCDHARSRAGCGCDKPEMIAIANSQYGRRISHDTVVWERSTMPPEEFGRDRMGWWDKPDVEESTTPFDLEKFGPLAVKKRVELASPLALGFEVHPGGESASIAIWMRQAGGLGYGELVEDREGTDWLVARLVELARKYKACTTVMNPAGPAGAYRQELLAEETGFVECAPKEKPAAGKQRLTLITAGEYGQACGSLVDDTRNRRWRYFFDQAPLIDAVEGVRTKPLLDAYKWSWKDSVVNIAPLNALTLAKHGFAAFGQAATAPFALWGR